MRPAIRAKTLLTDSDVKQKTLAAAIGVTAGQMSNYLTEKNEMPLHVITGIARYFHVSADYLLGLTDDPTPAFSLSASERSLVEQFRTLGRDQKEVVLAAIAVMQKQNQR